MRIVLVNHGTAGDWGGGDSVQISETAKRLMRRGHVVSVQNNDSPNVKNADLVHIFNSRVYNSFKKQVAVCHAEGIPIVVSPIWISIGRALWGSRATFNILRKGTEEGEDKIQKEMEQLRTRDLIIELENGTINADGKGTYDLTWQQELSYTLKHVDGILTNSWLELKALQTDLQWSGNKYGIANYGVDPKVFLDADPEPFRKYTGIKGPFVMQAGRIEAGKNQAMLCWALRKTNLPIVLIGGTKHWPAYAELCKTISGNKLVIIDHLPQELLASAYAAAKVHCLASWMDTCGLVSLEAALNEVPLVGSTFGHELEYLQNDAFLADPANPIDLRESVEEAWETGRGRMTRRLKERVLSDYNWEKTTTRTEEIYQKVIESA